MLSTEEKLQHFSKMIFDEAEKQKQEILAQAEKECQLMQEKFETQCLEVAYKTIQKKISAMQKESNEAVSRMQLESKQQLLARREEMVVEVFSEVENKMRTFKESDEYEAFLIGQIRAGMKDVGEDGITVFIDKGDRKLSDKISAAFPGVKVSELPDEEKIIGGARVYCESTKALSDQTLSFLLSEQKNRFLNTSGLAI